MIKYFFFLISGIVLCHASQIFAEGVGYGTTTGGAGGDTVVVSTLSDFKTYTQSSQPYVVMVSGTIDIGQYVRISGNKTICGTDTSSTIKGEISMNDINNVIIKNLNITQSGSSNDGISLRGTTHVLITHCTVYDCPDGLIDITLESDSVTVSYCKFYYSVIENHKYPNLVGASDDNITDRGKLHVTFHHNWWADGCFSRMPNARFGKIHVYNNYYSCTGNNYCARARTEAEILSEYNYYDQVRDPLLAEDGGFAKSIGNIYYMCTNEIYPGEDSIFTPTYDYNLTSATCAKTEVMGFAGNIPQNKIFTAKINRLDNNSMDYYNDEPIDSVQYQWSDADSIAVAGLPEGITASTDFDNQIVTLEGTPETPGIYVLQIQSFGCAQSIEITDTMTVVERAGIDPAENQINIAVFPNPSGNETSFRLSNHDKIISISIYQLNGIVTYSRKFNGDNTITVKHDLAPGIYIVALEGYMQKYFAKLIVR